MKTRTIATHAAVVGILTLSLGFVFLAEPLRARYEVARLEVAPNEEVEAQAQAVAQIGAPAIPFVIRIMKGDELASRNGGAALAQMLERADEDEKLAQQILHALAESFRNLSPTGRVWALTLARTSGRVHATTNEDCRRIANAGLLDADPKIRLEAIVVAAQLQMWHEELITRLFADPNEHVRRAAFSTFGNRSED
jgi:hypothetical protein